MNSRHHFRPRTDRVVAGRADALEQCGLNLRDWFHELRLLTTRQELLAAVSHRTPRLRARFESGQIVASSSQHSRGHQHEPARELLALDVADVDLSHGMAI